jgi:NAD(P)-dependent dehydrogenase (short-subunit alcohol dehydrogenase family)
MKAGGFMSKLLDKVALVTGAAEGNGSGIAKVLASHGAHVILTDIQDKVFDTAKALASAGYRVSAFKMDVAKYYEVVKVVKEAIDECGQIDILVNNAGIIRLAPFLDMSDAVRDQIFSVNFFGVWNCAKAVLPYMIKQNYGKIINMSSVTGTMVADAGETAYAATKAAIWGFTKALAFEVAKHHITVNAICPGYILTPMAELIARESNPDNPKAVLDGIAQAIPAGRLGTTEELGDLAAFLASDDSRYITGTQIVIDGGSTLPETFGAVGIGE